MQGLPRPPPAEHPSLCEGASHTGTALCPGSLGPSCPCSQKSERIGFLFLLSLPFLLPLSELLARIIFAIPFAIGSLSQSSHPVPTAAHEVVAAFFGWPHALQVMDTEHQTPACRISQPGTGTTHRDRGIPSTSLLPGPPKPGGSPSTLVSQVTAWLMVY